VSNTSIAAQMYTLREFCKTPADVAVTMKKVRAIGYEAVQLSGIGPIDTGELAAICQGEGLFVCATHVSFDDLQEDIQKQIDYHKTLACPHAAIGGLPTSYRGSGEGFAQFAKDANEVGRKLGEADITFSYHNHHFEFEKFGDEIGLDIIYNNTDPKYLLAEIDTYWVQAGGGDVVGWVEKVAGRMKLLHLKDLAIKSTPDGVQQRFAEIGEGNLDWPGIFDAAKKAGVEWYIVEQDNCYDRDPFDSLKISLENMKAMGLQ
jgi:sugar phosphate isomerase/epimerase